MDGEWLKDDEEFSKDMPKMTWVAANGDAVPVTLVELDYLFDKDDNPNLGQTWFETLAWAEPGISVLSKGRVVQFMKRGYFIMDKVYLGRPEEPARMIFVPDGKNKAMSELQESTIKVEISTR